MDPDFDFDSLIADYQEFDEPPPSQHPDDGLFDADEWEEQRADKDGPVDAPASSLSSDRTYKRTDPNEGPGTRSASPERANAAHYPPEHADAGDDGSPEGFEDHDDDEKDDDIATDRRKKKDPYAFERYVGNTAWRTSDEAGGAASPNAAMRATQWKKSSSDVLASRGTSASRQLFGLGLRANARPAEQPFSLCNRRSVPETSKLYCTYYPKPGDTSLTMTCRNGNRMYIRVEKENDKSSHGGRSSVATSFTALSASSSLLGVSIGDLLRRVQSTRRKREHENLSHIIRSTTHPVESAAPGASTQDGTDGARPSWVSPSPSRAGEDSRMWVDKYAPTSFSHLLSDERTNREVVRALRAWDPYVFRREPPPPPIQRRPEFAGSSLQNPPGDRNKPFFHKAATPNANPKDNRPDAASRVTLLSGPPGIGKTTLAHVLARHVGYNPVEVNGSDDRSAQFLRERIAALESNRIDFHRNDGRPGCLILDEIDGVDGKGAIEALVDIVKAEIPLKSHKKKGLYLRRPLILICNNKYAPALRPILPHCRHFNLAAPSQTRLISRLRACLLEEHLVVSGTSVLHHLGAVAGGDIRSCLHTLQFVASRARLEAPISMLPADDSNNNASQGRKQVDVSKAVVDALASGQKDVRNDVASIVTHVFRKEKPKRVGSKDQNSVGKVLQAVQAFGDNERILDCLFMNVLGVSYIDPTMDKCYAAHEWLSDADLYRNGLESHMPATAGAVHLLCRVEQRPNLTFTTRQFFEAHCQLEANRNLLRKVAEGADATIARGNGCVGLALETVPYSLWMLSAGEGTGALDRPVTSVGLLNGAEVQSFQRHLDVLNSLGLSYQFAGGETGDNRRNLQLEPPIDRVARYNDLKLSQGRERRDVSPSIKELLARRVEHDHVCSASSKGNAPMPLTGEAQETERPTDATVVEGRSNLPRVSENSSPFKRRDQDDKHLKGNSSLPPAKRSKPTVAVQNFLLAGAKRAKELKSARNAARVGFTRSEGEKLSHTGSGVPLARVLRLKYVKGFTEAVRKPCTLQDLK